MKAQTFSKALFMGLFCGSALASIHVTNNPNGTIQAVYSVADDAASLFKRDCTANNCVRALKARPDAATSFCRSFTTAVNTNVAPFTQCVGAAKASSACTCLVPVSTMGFTRLYGDQEH